MTSPASSTPPKRRLRLGFIGIGVGAAMVLPAVEQSDEYELVAGADINPRVRQAFNERYPEARVYESGEALLSDPDVEAVWNATPNQYHERYVSLAAQVGKHIIAEKPFAISLEEAARMVEAVEKHGVKLVAGHTLGFSPPVQAMRRVIRSGRIGRLTAISTFAHTDWQLQPRTPEEVDVATGGSMVFRQTPHQVDAIRVLGGGMLRSVRGHVGQWSPVRPAPGYYSAYLEFEDGTPVNMVYDGYGHFVLSELWGDERGIFGRYDIQKRAEVRQTLLAGTMDESGLKDEQRIGGPAEGAVRPAGARERKPWAPLHLGLLVAQCEEGLMRQSPFGIYVYGPDGREDVSVEAEKTIGWAELHELYEAVALGKPVRHTARWGMATLEVAIALLQSSGERREVFLQHQVPLVEDE